jgi:Skp family chaperone for outer membrane proteins
MRRTSLIPALAVALLGVGLLAARPSITTAAPRAAASGLPLGFVDIKKVFNDAPAAQAAVRQAEQLKSQLQGELTLMQETLALTGAEQKQIRELMEKKNPSEAEKAKIAELRGRTAKLAEEQRSLQQKPNPTDAERARLKELTDLFMSAETRLQSEMENRQGQLNQKGDELMSALQEKILKAVEETAKEQGLSMVVDKQARLFGGVDITSGVVNRLKK